MSPRTEVLHEAKALEEIGADWEIQHAAAFCGVSVTTIYRSSCPRVEKEGVRGVKGKPMVYFKPAAVRDWNLKRERAA